MYENYKEKHFSWLLFLVFMVVLFLILVMGLNYLGLLITSVIVFGWLLVYFNLFIMTIKVADDALVVSYGIGLFSQAIYYSEIENSKIQSTGGFGWMYNPSAQNSLMLVLRDGSTANLAVREPKQLMNLISNAVRN